jgi:hypothetical protein
MNNRFEYDQIYNDIRKQLSIDGFNQFKNIYIIYIEKKKCRENLKGTSFILGNNNDLIRERSVVYF